MNAEELQALADRLDQSIRHLNPYASTFGRTDPLTPEQRDLAWACINLRRYASDKTMAEEKAAPGRVYMRGFKLERVTGNYPRDRGCGDNEWHGAINQFSEARRQKGEDWPGFMYTAKTVSDEVPRMILLFERERRGLASSFKLCAHDPAPATELKDNHLRCHLGVECRKCPYLAAIEAEDRMTNEAKDEAKAWTCATHILLESSPDTHFEGMLRDKSDDAFDAQMVANHAGVNFEPET